MNNKKIVFSTVGGFIEVFMRKREAVYVWF